ncbi:MAG: flagellar hook-length control protein [Herbinix sp.]|jgi:flagellar hook-length control protein FliK|nr:flagellar hook-length control protein [Herbinix sp.]
MVTTNINSQSVNRSTAASSIPISKEKQEGNGFDQLLIQNINYRSKSEDTVISTNERTGSKQDSAKDYTKKDLNASEKADRKKTEADESVTEKDTITSKKASQNKEVKDQVDQEKVNKDSEIAKDTKNTDDTTAQINAMLLSVQETVMEVLHISPEEFQDLMNEMGIEAVDLLDSDILKDFILNAKGITDITSLLTDENLAATVDQLLSNVNVINQESGIGLTNDQMKEFLAQLDKGPSVDLMANFDVETDVIDDEAKNDQAINLSNQHRVESLAKDINLENSSMSDTNTESFSSSSNETEANSDTVGTNDQKNTFINNMVMSVKETQVSSQGEIVRVTELREIANQIIEQIKVVIKPNHSSMELQLNPEHLGKVNLTVNLKDGAMTANFVVQNEIAKEAIESQVQTLKEALNNQGIKVDAIDVTVAGYEFGQSNQADTQEQQMKQSNGKKTITLDAINDFNDEIPEEEDDTNTNELLGSRIDYTA